MDFSGPTSNTGDPAFHLDWWGTRHASLELAAADVVRMAANYLLAGCRIAGSMPDSVRRLEWWQSWPSLQYAATNRPAHGRALGEDDARGARGVPPKLARPLRRLCSANQRNQGAIDPQSTGGHPELLDRFGSFVKGIHESHFL